VDDIVAKGRAKPSQFVFGQEMVLRQLAVARECSASWLTRLDPTRSFPTWRVNTLEFVGEPTPAKVTAKLQNGWGQVSGQPIKFTAEGSSASCTATTNNEGVASCGSTGFTNGKVNAEFVGAQTSQFVDLPATAQAALPEPPESGGGCTIGRGGFDPMLAGLTLLAALGLIRRRRSSRK
jgi:MYXO-CTERM domain-containing protein